MVDVQANRPAQWTVRVETIGHEQTPIVIIDDALQTPQAHIDNARQQNFKPLAPHYPGIRAPATRAYLAEMMPGILPILRDTFGFAHGADVAECFYSLVTTPPGDLKPMQRLPHIDGFGDEKLALLHYLSPHDSGGTYFYRHRTTGFETVPQARFEEYRSSVNGDAKRLGIPEPAYPSGDTEMFERTHIVDAKFNRAVIYRGISIHAVGLPDDFSFAPNVDEGRLTVNTFLKPAAPR